LNIFALPADTGPVDEAKVEERFAETLRELHRRTDRFFARLLVVEWLAAVILALAVSPLSWAGRTSSIHMHVWLALAGGAAISIYPAWIGLRNSGFPFTRHVLAVAQMLMSGLLIHLTGGRIETHFHVFGSLAFLAFYRDIKVLLSATTVVYIDHLLRGFLWPESVYGVMIATPWRSMEHAFWVLFEVAFLTASVRRSLAEMRQVAQRQILLEAVNRETEKTVQDRTHELSVSEERFRALFQNAPVGLYQAAPDGRLLMANPKLLHMLGYASLEALLAAGVRLQGADHDQARAELFAELSHAGEVHSRDTQWQRQNGAPIFVRESAQAFRDKHGTLLHIEGSVEDVTERRQLEERYLQAQKVQAIGQLAGGVAHDFNNILTAILGYSDIVMDVGGLNTGGRKYLSEIKTAAQRAAGLTQQLLAFGRKQTLQPRVIQLNTVVAEMDTMLRRLVGEHIHIRTIAAPDLARVKADPGQIQQVLMNLAVNARDAMVGGGNMTIETCNVTLDADYARLHPEVLPGPYVMLAVSDNGMGMSADTKARIFEPFFTTKAVGAGTGLGLATCHGIVKQSGGHIAVYSELGHGTTFKVYLPPTAESLTPQNGECAGELRHGSETVLLVEDEPMVRELSRLALSSLGYQVYEAPNGREALERMKELGETFVDLLVTDVVMPEMGGRELAERLRVLSPRTRVLFSSGYTYDAIERTDLLAEGIFFLQKPYTVSQLAEKAREVLAGAAHNPAEPGAAKDQ
jgi:PAS domain S-box-containing protein